MVIGKGGFISNKDDLELASKVDKHKVNEKEYYSISDDWLEISLNRSLEMLNLKCLDLYLLHNPETLYQIEKTVNNSEKDEKIRERVYNKILKAFKFLESKVQKGVIKSYGISSNTLVENSSSPSFLSLSQLHTMTKQQGLDKNFLGVQYPFNLLETGATKNNNQNSNTQTLFQYAKVINLFYYFYIINNINYLYYLYYFIF